MQITCLPALKDNYIWLIHGRDAPSRVLAVDPGESAPVERALAGSGLELAGILVTHHHWDHTDGIEALVDAFGCEVWGPARETVPRRTHALEEGDRVQALGWEFEVYDIPGHTAGHIALHGHGVLFTGDTLFTAGCGRMFEGTPTQMYDSLMKLTALPAATELYCGHEYTVANLAFAQVVEPDNPAVAQRRITAERLREAGEPTVPGRLADELSTNPFLRCDTATVRAAASAREGRELENPVEVFATVRRWKDTFR